MRYAPVFSALPSSRHGVKQRAENTLEMIELMVRAYL